MLREVDPQNEIAVLESSTEMVVDSQKQEAGEAAELRMDIIRKTDQGWILARKVIFDRTNLRPHHQIIYDDRGNLVTEASYQVFKDYNGIQFPGLIEIKRPQEEYDIRLIMVKLTINQPLTDDQFALQQPAGSELVNLDERNANANAKPGASAATSAQTAPNTNSASHH